jgi:hypothetical protein
VGSWRKAESKDKLVWGKKKKYWFIYSKSLMEYIFLVMIKFGNIFCS